MQIISFNYPAELIGKDVSGLHICRALGYNNCIIYSFNMIDGLYVSNDTLSFEKVPLEKNYKFKLIEYLWKSHMADIKAALRYNLAL